MRGSNIVFIEAPDAGSADIWLRSRRRAILDPPAHLHHLMPKTLQEVLAKAGYDVLEVQLFNAYPIEGVLAFRAERTDLSMEASAAGSDAEHPHPSASAGESVRALWPRVLTRARSVLPGDKLQVTARRAT